MENDNYQDSKGYGYKKRPWWVWVLVYVVVAAIVYGLVYYFFFAKKGGYGPQYQQNQPYYTPTATPANM